MQIYCPWKILDISWTRVVDDMLVPLLVWCSLDLFQCCVFILLLWSTKLTFYTWYKSISWSFISWTLFWYLSFLTVILKIEKPQDCVFTDFARLVMVSAVYLFHFLDGRSFVPMQKIISSGFSRRIGFPWSSRHLTTAPWHGLTQTSRFSNFPEIS